MVDIPSTTVRQIDAVNTVVFGSALRSQGYNTDYSGFLRAYQQRFPQEAPGVVGIVGAGGVGKPVACGLAELGASALRLYDLDGIFSISRGTPLRMPRLWASARECPY